LNLQSDQMKETPERRKYRLYSTLFLLGIFLFVPSFSGLSSHGAKLLVSAFMFFCFLTALLVYLDKTFFGNTSLWVLLVLSAILFFKNISTPPLILSALFSVWRLMVRERLIKSSKWDVTIGLAFVFVIQTVYAKSDVEIPKYLSGYEVKDITSCGVVDKIPWKFRPDGKKTRLLLKDKLRHQTETQTLDWEVFQIMDKDGFTSWVFRRTLASGRAESIVIKDVVYNRILETKKGPKTVEVQDLRSLVNRPALTFYHKDGSTLVYSPSSVGRSALIIQQGNQSGGRILAPVFVRGNFCDRPEDEENSDSQSKKAVQGSTGAADAASSTGNGASGGGAK
jgi:hypothetical protein